MANVEWPGYARLMGRLSRVGKIDDADWHVLMDEFEGIIREDNRKGVLAGLDKDGKPLARVTYRDGQGKRTAARKGQAFGSASGTRKGRGFGGQAAGDPHANGNLTTAEYRKLNGPPLAPRRDQSRVIANLTTDAVRISDSQWQAIGFWEEVLSPKGVPFLPAHFQGKGRLPKRDLRGVRPWGMNETRKAVRAWVRMLLKP